MKKHSDKAHETFAQMNTKANDWGLTPILWVEEEMSVPTKFRCPTCSGTGQAPFRANGKLWVNPYVYQDDWVKWQDEQQAMRRLGKRGQCPTCPPRRGISSYGTGEVIEWKIRKVMVGYPQWAPKTKFDSRFKDHNRVNCVVCELCSKTIKKFMSRIPVNGKGPDGTVHGMWVGLDCAQKFLGIKSFGKDHFVKQGES